jgi:hypothetical protein
MTAVSDPRPKELKSTGKITKAKRVRVWLKHKNLSSKPSTTRKENKSYCDNWKVYKDTYMHIYVCVYAYIHVHIHIYNYPLYH